MKNTQNTQNTQNQNQNRTQDNMPVHHSHSSIQSAKQDRQNCK